VGNLILNIHTTFLDDDVIIVTSLSRKVACMFRIKFHTKRIFRIFPILRTGGMAPFCNLWNDPHIIRDPSQPFTA